MGDFRHMGLFESSNHPILRSLVVNLKISVFWFPSSVRYYGYKGNFTYLNNIGRFDHFGEIICFRISDLDTQNS